MLVDSQGNPIKKRVEQDEEKFTSFHLKETSTTTLTLLFDTEEDGDEWLKQRKAHASMVRDKAAAAGVTITLKDQKKKLKGGAWQYKVIITSNKTEKFK